MTRRQRSDPWLERAAVLLAVAWLATSAIVTVTWHRAGRPDPADLASSASGLAHGRVWTLLSSALPVAQYPLAELAGCALTVAVAIRLLGGVWFWAVALASHVGSALIAYASIAVLWLVAPSAVSEVAVQRDYGISTVWYGSIGAIAVVLYGEGRRRAALVVAGAAVAASIAALTVDADSLAAAEHVLALAIGATVARALGRPRAAPSSAGRRPATPDRRQVAFDPQRGQARARQAE